MKMSAKTFQAASILAALVTAGMVALPAHAVMPVVKTVPWVATNPLVPHTTYPTKLIRLKGTADQQGANFQYAWDFGDGSPQATGTVTNKYAIEASHTYAGTVGTVWTARLTVTDTNTGESASKTYFVEMKDKNLVTEVNVAIDEGLWYLHKNQVRTVVSGADVGYWNSASVGSGYYANDAANVNAFEVNGHLENGAGSNPYTETVARGLKRIFQYLTVRSSVPLQNTGLGSFNPDANGNGISLYTNQSDPYYQGGSLIDAIVASGTPNAVATAGPANVIGRTYVDIVQDMADEYSYCQYDGTPGGGWRYSCNTYPDNSANQWGAIGLIGAEHFGATVPQMVKDWNRNWLDYSQNPTTGVFGYTDTSPIWGPYAVTPSGMVQMTMDGIGRGSSPASGPSWEGAETFMRESWDNAQSGATYSVKDYYYGLFSFTKSMLLHDPNGDGTPDSITCLRSLQPGTTKLPIDWYAAEAGKPDNVCAGGMNASSNGVARTLVNDQNATGYWYGNDYTSQMYTFDTAWAIMMLNRTVFESGVPVAVAKAVPNPSVVGQLITLDGSESFHQDASKQLDSWQWDFDNNGTWDALGPVVTTSYPALGTYPVTLRVTDNGSPEKAATTIVQVNVTIPPLAPTADADGPYNFCPQTTFWYLNGSGSVNPDNGMHEAGLPGDTIQSYEWDLDGDGQFNDASGAQPDVTAYFQGVGTGNYLVQLKVTDTTSISFPSSGLGDLSNTDTATVHVLSGTDPACSCISNLVARPKSGKVQLTWTAYPGASSYNVYRSTVNGGPYAKIGSTASTYSTYLDGNVVNGTIYYYVVRAAAVNADELCQSNQANAKPTKR
jgi:hypothetical protein